MPGVRLAGSVEPGLAMLMARYLSFVWLFEAEPARADRITRMSIRRRNREAGRRYLPIYLARYLRLLLCFALIGFAVEALAAPALVVGACFTVSTLAAVAAIIVIAGLIGMQTRDA